MLISNAFHRAINNKNCERNKKGEEKNIQQKLLFINKTGSKHIVYACITATALM